MGTLSKCLLNPPQMINRTGDKVRTMSEPWSLVHVHGLFNTKQLSMPEYQRLLRSVVRDDTSMLFAS